MKQQKWEESEKRKEEERRAEKKKSQKKEDPGARKDRKVAKHNFVQCFVAPEVRNLGWGAETSVQMRDQKLHAPLANSKC